MTDKTIAAHPCDQCPKAFGRKGDLTRHKYLHMGVRRFRCDKCKKSFNQLSGWKTHQNVHNGNKPYVCGYDDCLATFGDPSSCARHRKETHRRIGAYCCPEPYCTSRIKRRSAFAAHLRKHGIDASSIDLESFAPPLLPAPKAKPPKLPKLLIERDVISNDFAFMGEDFIDQFSEESPSDSSTSSTPIEALPWSTDYMDTFPTQIPSYPNPYVDFYGTRFCVMDTPPDLPISGEYFQYPISTLASSARFSNEMKRENNQTPLYPDVLCNMLARDVASCYQNPSLSFGSGKFYADLPFLDLSAIALADA